MPKSAIALTASHILFLVIVRKYQVPRMDRTCPRVKELLRFLAYP